MRFLTDIFGNKVHVLTIIAIIKENRRVHSNWTEYLIIARTAIGNYTLYKSDGNDKFPFERDCVFNDLIETLEKDIFLY